MVGGGEVERREEKNDGRRGRRRKGERTCILHTKSAQSASRVSILGRCSSVSPRLSDAMNLSSVS